MVQVVRRADGPGMQVWISQLVQGNIVSTLWYDGGVSFYPAALTPTCGDNQICYDQTRYLLADFDGDGKADLMAITPRQGGTAFWLLKSTGSAFAAPQLYAQTDSTFNYGHAQQYVAGNFDGVGGIDVLIAETRAEGGLDFWVLNNDGARLNAPELWASATNVSNAAKLFAASLNSDALTDIVAVDGTQNLRVTTYASTGSRFKGFSPQRSYKNLNPIRSRVVVARSPATGFSDLWVLAADTGGPSIDIWKLAGTRTGFLPPVLQGVETSVAWSDIKPYATTDGNQIWLPYRVNAPVGEYQWTVGAMGVKAVTLNPIAPAFDFGVNPNFLWTDIQWRARLNSAQ